MKNLFVRCSGFDVSEYGESRSFGRPGSLRMTLLASHPETPPVTHLILAMLGAHLDSLARHYAPSSARST